ALPTAVRAKKPENGAGGHIESETIEGAAGAVGPSDVACGDDWSGWRVHVQIFTCREARRESRRYAAVTPVTRYPRTMRMTMAAIGLRSIIPVFGMIRRRGSQ